MSTSAGPTPTPLNREQYLQELQRRIAEVRGYKDLNLIFPLEGTGRNTPLLYGTLHADEGYTLVPRWPWDIGTAWQLVEEMEETPDLYGYFMDGYFMGGETQRAVKYVFCVFSTEGDVAFEGEGCTVPESIVRCFLAWKGVDLSDLPSVGEES